ncbi:MAG: bis(5'-nucleosyl)-tetraphosphatase (symmetrical) YqeK [Lentihominibacter sp.]
MDYTEYKELKKSAIDYIETNLSEGRIKHTYAVTDEADKLARCYGADPMKIKIVSLLHDMARSMPVDAMNMYIQHLDLPAKYKNNPNLAHSKIGAELAARELGIDDEEILDGISYHTTGRAHMSLVEKIIFLADAIEPGRNYPGVDEIRKLAYEDIDAACAKSLSGTIEFITSKGKYLDEDTVSALESLVNKKQKEIQDE